MHIIAFINDYAAFFLIGLLACILLLTILLLLQMSKLKGFKKRFEFFTGANRRPDYNLETRLHEYYETVTDVNQKYSKVLAMVQDLDENMKHCAQKIGIVRYNPFEEMGGNLCFAVALLDKDDNGVVFNGIHGRNGSYTYAKPVELGVSAYILSTEELEAINRAKASAHVPLPEEEKIMRVIMPPKKYRVRYKDYVQRIQNRAEEEKAALARAEAERIAAQQAQLAEQERIAAELAQLAEEERMAKEQVRLAEEERIAAQQAQLAEQERIAAELAQLAEEERIAEELAEQKRMAEEQAQLAEQERIAEELAEQERMAEELAEQERIAEEQARLAEEERMAKEQAELAEQERIAEELAELTELAEQERMAEEPAEIPAPVPVALEHIENVSTDWMDIVESIPQDTILNENSPISPIEEQEPIIEEPIIEEPITEEPIVEPITEEPIVEPIAEEPIAQPLNHPYKIETNITTEEERSYTLYSPLKLETEESADPMPYVSLRQKAESDKLAAIRALIKAEADAKKMKELEMEEKERKEKEKLADDETDPYTAEGYTPRRRRREDKKFRF